MNCILAAIGLNSRILPGPSPSDCFQPVLILLYYHVFSLCTCLGLRVRATPKSIYIDGGLFAFFLPLHFYLLLSDFIPYITVSGEEP